MLALLENLKDCFLQFIVRGKLMYVQSFMVIFSCRDIALKAINVNLMVALDESSGGHQSQRDSSPFIWGNPFNSY